MSISPVFLMDKWTRMNTLYMIQDEAGRVVPFRMNAAQQQLFDEMWYMNVILKARQLGMTTFIDLLFLDECIFRPGVEAAIIAHNLEDAKKILRRKIKFPYDNLPAQIREEVSLVGSTKSELQFSNGSVLYVDTSTRSATVQYLHISEHGKICRKYPDKAEELKTGALNAIHAGQYVFIESTAEGMAGDFYDICMTAMRRKRAKADLTKMDFEFHFYPWFEHPEYRLPEAVVVPQELAKYFDGLESSLGMTLPIERRHWYAKKWELMGEKMWQEFPSTPEEAFKSSLDGSYYASQFAKIYKDQRICTVRPEEGYPVHTAWDLGMDDYTCIGFFQLVGREVRFIDYYENSGEGLEHYLNVLREKAYAYGQHYFPHDVQVRELTLRESQGRTRKEFLESLGLRVEVAPNLSISDGIEASRRMLSLCVFDETNCGVLVSHLENYSKEWDARLGMFKASPRHDEHSHAADMFRIAAVSCEQFGQGQMAPPPSWQKLRSSRKAHNWRTA